MENWRNRLTDTGELAMRTIKTKIGYWPECNSGFRFGVAEKTSDEVLAHCDTEKEARKEAHRCRTRGLDCEAVLLEFPSA